MLKECRFCLIVFLARTFSKWEHVLAWKKNHVHMSQLRVFDLLRSLKISSSTIFLTTKNFGTTDIFTQGWVNTTMRTINKVFKANTMAAHTIVFHLNTEINDRNNISLCHPVTVGYTLEFFGERRRYTSCFLDSA